MVLGFWCLLGWVGLGSSFFVVVLGGLGGFLWLVFLVHFFFWFSLVVVVFCGFCLVGWFLFCSVCC